MGRCARGQFLLLLVQLQLQLQWTVLSRQAQHTRDGTVLPVPVNHQFDNVSKRTLWTRSVRRYQICHQALELGIGPVTANFTKYFDARGFCDSLDFMHVCRILNCSPKNRDDSSKQVCRTAFA